MPVRAYEPHTPSRPGMRGSGVPVRPMSTVQSHGTGELEPAQRGLPAPGRAARGQSPVLDPLVGLAGRGSARRRRGTYITQGRPGRRCGENPVRKPWLRRGDGGRRQHQEVLGWGEPRNFDLRGVRGRCFQGAGAVAMRAFGVHEAGSVATWRRPALDGAAAAVLRHFHRGAVPCGYFL